MWTEILKVHFLLEGGKRSGDRSLPELLQGFRVSLGAVLLSRVPGELGKPSSLAMDTVEAGSVLDSVSFFKREQERLGRSRWREKEKGSQEGTRPRMESYVGLDLMTLKS